MPRVPAAKTRLSGPALPPVDEVFVAMAAAQIAGEADAAAAKAEIEKAPDGNRNDSQS